ncbi:MAG TPA: hypothetical protein DHW64_10690 [Chitinophagaceae bacterium]|nr:hypothetical protein [Chitinophagaceae bacterium]
MAKPDFPKVGMFLAHIKGESKIKYMKSFFLTIGLALTLMSFTFQGPTDAIVRSLKSASAEQVASHFDDFVDMKLLEKDEVKNMGKNQATIALKYFFGEKSIKGFEKISEREIGNTMYMTGKLLNNDKGYNITVMLKQKGGQYQIVTVRIN